MKSAITKRLIVNADDFGLTKQVNLGIAQGFSRGIITSSTILMNSKFSEHAADLAKKRNLDVGIHLNLAEFQPLSLTKKISKLIDKKGNFKPVLRMGYAASSSSLVRSQIQFELEAQIKKFNSLGLKASHVDTHHWSSMFPAINEIVLKLAKKYRISKARCAAETFSWPLCFGFKSTSLGAHTSQFLKYCLIPTLSRTTKSQFEKYNIQKTDHYYGIMQTAAKDPLEYFTAVLKNLRTGSTELMVHPGFYSRDLDKLSWYGRERELELLALMNPKLKRLINAQRIELIGWKEL